MVDYETDVGPSSHYAFSLFAHATHVAGCVQAEANRKPGSPAIDACPSLDDVDPALVAQLQDLLGPIGMFLHSLDAISADDSEASERTFSALYTRAWNELVVALDDTAWPADVKQAMLTTHRQPLNMRSVSSFTGIHKPVQCPMKLGFFQPNLTLDELDRYSVMCQVENQLAQVDILHQAATGSELRVPFFQERISQKGYYLDGIIPCHRGDPIITNRDEYYDYDIDARKSTMLQVPLVRLHHLPGAKSSYGFPVIAAQLIALKELARLHQTPGVNPRTTWHRPTQALAEEAGWIPVVALTMQHMRPPVFTYTIEGDSPKKIVVKVNDDVHAISDFAKQNQAVDMAVKLSCSAPIKEGMVIPAILAALKQEHPAEYSSWKSTRLHPQYAMLECDYVDGSMLPKSWVQFVKAMDIVRTAHDHKFVHGDILPQNLIYHSDGVNSTVLDWDMTRSVADGAQPTYSSGYLCTNHEQWRHPQADRNELMKMAHDAWAMACMAEYWFRGEGLEDWVKAVKSSELVTEALVNQASALTIRLAFKY